MAEVNTGDSGGGGKHQKKRAKKSSTRIDMTPMVDLAFLLLTFFVLTSTFSKPTTMEITMPVKDEKTEPTKVKHVLTVLLTGDDKIFYYYGVLDTTGTPEIKETNFDQTKGIRKVIMEMNKPIIDEIAGIEKEVKKLQGKVPDDTIKARYERQVIAVHKRTSDQGEVSLTVIIKPDKNASYKNVIDIVDEMSIAQIGKYAIVDISGSEIDLLKKINP